MWEPCNFVFLKCKSLQYVAYLVWLVQGEKADHTISLTVPPKLPEKRRERGSGMGRGLDEGRIMDEGRTSTYDNLEMDTVDGFRLRVCVYFFCTHSLSAISPEAFVITYHTVLAACNLNGLLDFLIKQNISEVINKNFFIYIILHCACRRKIPAPDYPPRLGVCTLVGVAVAAAAVSTVATVPAWLAAAAAAVMSVEEALWCSYVDNTTNTNLKPPLYPLMTTHLPCHSKRNMVLYILLLIGCMIWVLLLWKMFSCQSCCVWR